MTTIHDDGDRDDWLLGPAVRAYTTLRLYDLDGPAQALALLRHGGCGDEELVMAGQSEAHVVDLHSAAGERGEIVPRTSVRWPPRQRQRVVAPSQASALEGHEDAVVLVGRGEGDGDGDVWVWNLRTATTTIVTATAPVVDGEPWLCTAGSGTFLAAPDGQVLKCNTAEGHTSLEPVLPAIGERVGGFEVLGDGRVMAVQTFNGMLHLRDLRDHATAPLGKMQTCASTVQLRQDPFDTHRLVALSAKGQLVGVDSRNLSSPTFAVQLEIMGGTRALGPITPTSVQLQASPVEQGLWSVAGMQAGGALVDVFRMGNYDTQCLFRHRGHAFDSAQGPGQVLSHLWHPTLARCVISSDTHAELQCWQFVK